MSGICGLIDFGAGFTGKKLATLMGNMQQAMIHRGFERDSLWLDEQTQVALSDCHLLTSRTAVLTNSTAQIHIVYDGDALASTRGDKVEPNQHPPVLAELAHVFADPTKSPIDALRAIDTPIASGARCLQCQAAVFRFGSRMVCVCQRIARAKNDSWIQRNARSRRDQ